MNLLKGLGKGKRPAYLPPIWSDQQWNDMIAIWSSPNGRFIRTRNSDGTVTELDTVQQLERSLSP